MINQKDVRELHAKGKTVREIADALGHSREAIDYHIRRLNLVPNYEGIKVNPDEVRKLHAEGKANRQIAQIVGCTSEAIWYHLEKLGLATNYKRMPRSLSEAGLSNAVLCARRLRTKVFEKLGGKCVRCGFSDTRALQIDHIDGGGCKYNRSTPHSARLRDILNGCGPKVQLLCANCNWVKKAENQEVYGGRFAKELFLIQKPTDLFQ